MHDVFISFSFQDQTLADRIVNQLTYSYSIPCWICTAEIRAGEDYYDKIADAILDAQIVVFVQTQNSVLSKEVPDEIIMAIQEGKTVISFITDDSVLRGKMRLKLSPRQHIDGRKPTLEERIEDLAVEICKALGRPLHPKTAEKRREPMLRSSRISCGELFFGREALLQEIDAAYQKRNTVFLYGIGGIGKSELATHYWQRFRQDYNTAVFARYEGSLEALIANDDVFSLEGMSRKIRADGALQTDAEYARDKLAQIRRTADSHTLIILDNFDTDYDPLMEELATEGKYRLLVTSRHAPERGRYHAITVGELNDPSLRQMFLEYADPGKTFIQEQDPAFTQLFDLTSRHTMTLELVAKYMDEKNIEEIGEMVALLEKNGLSALSDSEKKDGFAVIQNLFRMTNLSNQAKEFLRCMALMPEAGVDQKLFRQWSPDCYGIRSRLIDLSLIRINGRTRTLSLHPVIREVVFAELSPSYENCRSFLERCTMIGEDCIPKMWALPYEEKRKYLDCYRSLVSVFSRITPELYPLFVNMAHIFNYAGSYQEAMDLHQRICDFACQEFGADSRQTMMARNSAAWKNSNVMRYDLALPDFKAVADWTIRNPDYTSREAQSSIQNCAGAYFSQYQQTGIPEYLAEAYSYAKKFTSYGEKMLEYCEDASQEHITYLRYQNDCIAKLYFKICMEEQKFDEAELYLQKFSNAVHRMKQWFKTDELADMAYIGFHAGELKRCQGDHAGAKTELESSRHLFLTFFSEENKRLIPVLESLTSCCISLEDYASAEAYLSQTMRIAQKLYMQDHPVLVRLCGLRRTLEGRCAEIH